ncbi:protein of unknown function [Bradyrhizobium sp. ORS 285]|nr:hypothetical protein BRAO285_180019 [Bradyrhizobium sp. ORS 285]SMX61021.1 protein of unknown function [Bradyrhizobium sp. ORS 285]
MTSGFPLLPTRAKEGPCRLPECPASTQHRRDEQSRGKRGAWSEANWARVPELIGHDVERPLKAEIERGVDALKIMKQTRHVKVDTLGEYDRRESDFDDHVGADLL